MIRAVAVFCCSTVLAGCAVEPAYVPLSPWHPASPCAPESSLPPPGATLKIRSRELMPPHPDWQIPGKRDHEKHEHADGPLPADHGSMHGGSHGSSPKGEPGMRKMEAPEHVVDYAPHDAAAPAPAAAAPHDEHQPELHLEHTSEERRDAPTQQAPVAPPEDAKHEAPTSRHEGHSPAASPPQTPPASSEHRNH